MSRPLGRTLAAAPRSEREASGDRLVVAPVPRDRTLPLALAQERFWFLHQLDPASPADNIAVGLLIEGPFRPLVYQHAWDSILRRHEILRTRFPVVDGQPVQVVDRPSPASIAYVDLRSRPADVRLAEATAAAAEEADRPFDLAAGPSHRLTVYQLDQETHLALSVFHHISCDLWSLGVISHELVEHYGALAERRPARLLDLPFQYADYAASHRQWVEGPALDNQIAYWKQQLAGVHVPELATDRPRSRTPGTGATGVVDLPPDLLPAVRGLASREGATPFMVLMAAFSLLLHRYTGETDIVVGTPIANRTRRDLKALVGTFVNTLVLRTDVSGAQTFREVLARTRNVALGAFAHQDVSFHRLINALEVDRGSGRSPLFQVLFNVQNAPVRMPQIPGLRVGHVTLPRKASQFDLTVWVDTSVLHQLGYAFDTSLFDRETIEEMMAHYVALLGAVVSRPDQPLAELELVAGSERETLLDAFNQTTTPPPRETVVELFAARARQTPEAPAMEAGAVSLSYADLDSRADAVARGLRARGVGQGTIVGVCLHRHPDLVAVLLGVMRVGAAYLPLDPTFPPDRVAFMVRDAGVVMVVTEPALAGLVPEGVELVFARAMSSSPGPEPGSATATAGPALDDLAYVIYTSGSTGQPKGVEVTHAALANLLLSMAEAPGVNAGDRLLAVTTVAFDIAGLEIFLPLVTGATLVLASRDEAQDGVRLAAVIEARRATVMQGTPATWRMLVDTGWAGHRSLTVLCGGEALSRDLANQLLARSKAVWNLFGPTETTIWSTIERVGPGPAPVSIGRPVANTQVYVLDAQQRLAPIGVPGEMYIGGTGVARGYRNRPELTQERFLDDPFVPGARLYRTGDRVRFLRDGRLEWLGRHDSQVKIRGHRVEIGEVEACVRAVPGVGHAVVMTRLDPDGMPQLVAFVVGDGTSTLAPKIVRDVIGRKLPPYMLPSRIEVLDALPMTPNGKVDRPALEARSATPDATGRALPSTEVERRLCSIWAEVLGRRTVGVDDDFFDLGGHSLLAVQLVTAVERAFGQTLNVAALIEGKTVRQLARVIDEQRQAAAWRALVVLQPEGSKPPFFCVHGVGGEILGYRALAARMGTSRPFVAIQAVEGSRSGDPAHGIATQAATYVAEVRRFQPTGPYHLGGYSHGGRVALEMALQLEAAGEQVAFLGVLDTTPVRVHYNSPRYWWRVLKNAPRWFWDDARRTPVRENLDRVRRAARMLGRAIGLGRTAVKVPVPGADVRDMLNTTGMPSAYLERYQWDFRAFCSYRPAVRCGPVTVFKAWAQPLLASHDRDLGWGRVSRGPVLVVEVPGNHSSLLVEPAVDGLATALEEALERARLVSAMGYHAALREDA